VSSRTALARHPLSIAGALVTTAAAVVFVALATAAFAGLFDNPYAGLVIFVALPAVFLAGLLLIPLGMWLAGRRLARDPSAGIEWPVIDFRRRSVRRSALIAAALTAVNIVIFLVAGYGSLHSMESPAFCGQTCHTPMHPQFTAWQQASHSRVACVTCHIGDGGSAFVRYKLAGARQLMHVLGNSFPRPIPSGADMRPALQVCGSCHNPAASFGERLRVSHEYADDESNTETRTVLRMQVGGPGRPTASGRAIHWHADPAVRIEFVATDASRQTIPYVRVSRADGRTTEYLAEGTPPGAVPAGVRRVMDCVDCHNVTGHRIAPTPEQGIDRAIANGRVDRRLPFIRREAVRLVKAEYQSDAAALGAIAGELRAFYTSRTTSANPQTVGSAIAAVQDAYRRNVFPVMKVTWGVYPDNIGHLTSNGCFRCHDGSHTAPDGSAVSGDCEYCHVQVEEPPVPTSVVPSAN